MRFRRRAGIRTTYERAKQGWGVFFDRMAERLGPLTRKAAPKATPIPSYRQTGPEPLALSPSLGALPLIAGWVSRPPRAGGRSGCRNVAIGSLGPTGGAWSGTG